VLGDLLQSVGVIIAGALVWWKPSWQIADPIMTAVFSLLVICTTVPTMKQSVLLLMEGVPMGIDTEHIKKELGACDAVVAVHDLHIWSLSTSKPALAVHLVSDDHDAALASAQRYLIGRGITHTTIQVERPSAQYPQNCDETCT
jgi:zinc transporter 2